MKATYIGTGAQDDNLLCTVFGRDFPLGEAVEVSDMDDSVKERLRGNGTFTTDDPPAKAPAAPKA